MQHDRESSSRHRADFAEVNDRATADQLSWCREGKSNPTAFWALRILGSARTRNQQLSDTCFKLDSLVFTASLGFLLLLETSGYKPPLSTIVGTSVIGMGSELRNSRGLPTPCILSADV